jgi:hypothetical protein
MRISKRPRMENGILSLWQIPGLLPLIYSFLFKNLDYFETGHKSINLADYFAFREICKTSKTLSNQLISFISVRMESLEDLEKIGKVVPRLQLAIISTDVFTLCTTNPFLHLRGLCILSHDHIDSNFWNNCWNCASLKHLEVHASVTESTMHSILIGFPNLTYLYIFMESQPIFKISHFPKLQTLQLTPGYRNDSMQVEISDIPYLEKLELYHGKIDSLTVARVPNLKHISSSFLSINSVVFQDDVSLLAHVHFNYSPLSINGDMHVNWKNMKYLNIIMYSCIWDNILPRLKLLETLIVEEYIKEQPNVQWSNLTNLTRLEWIFPSFDLLRNISCVQSLQFITLHWGDEFILDCTQLLKFPNILKITLVSQSDKYVNFEALLHLPQNVEVICNMPKLTPKELLILVKRLRDQKML